MHSPYSGRNLSKREFVQFCPIVENLAGEKNPRWGGGDKRRRKVGMVRLLESDNLEKAARTVLSDNAPVRHRKKKRREKKRKIILILSLGGEKGVEAGRGSTGCVLRNP